jgi:hypothetical protein
MKKLVLSIALIAFAVAVQAGSDGACSEKSGACCSAKNASTEAKAECTMAKQAKVAKAKNGTKQVSSKQQPLKSPKATG